MEIDARGYACPRPVIMTKKSIVENRLEEVLVRVDNLVATENLSKMAEQLGFSAEVTEKAPDDFEVFLKKTKEVQREESSGEFAVIFASDKMGTGEEEFSKLLMENFVYALTEQDQLPKFVVCYNEGVHLTTQNEKTIADFKKLESQGVEILSCGLCLDNYKLREELKVGGISNMYRICEIQCKYKIVRP